MSSLPRILQSFDELEEGQIIGWFANKPMIPSGMWRITQQNDGLAVNAEYWDGEEGGWPKVTLKASDFPYVFDIYVLKEAPPRTASVPKKEWDQLVKAFKIESLSTRRAGGQGYDHFYESVKAAVLAFEEINES